MMSTGQWHTCTLCLSRQKFIFRESYFLNAASWYSCGIYFLWKGWAFSCCCNPLQELSFWYVLVISWAICWPVSPRLMMCILLHADAFAGIFISVMGNKWKFSNFWLQKPSLFLWLCLLLSKVSRHSYLSSLALGLFLVCHSLVCWGTSRAFVWMTIGKDQLHTHTRTHRHRKKDGMCFRW